MIWCDSDCNSDNVPLNDRMIDELEAMALLRFSAGIWLEWLAETANNLSLADDPTENVNRHLPITLL